MSARSGAVGPAWAGLRCVRCRVLAPVAADLYVCPACGANTLVEYDLDQVRRGWTRAALAADPDPTMWRCMSTRRT